MVRVFSSTVAWLSNWRRFCALMTLIFIVRGVFVMSVLPPFEGWDEYQHLTYIAYLAEEGRAPVLGEGNDVPRSLYPALVRYPHCDACIDQIGRVGALDYDAYWESRSPPHVREDAPRVLLYQAQQAPLYYWLATPAYRLLSGEDNTLALMTLLRGVNLLFGAAAVLVVLLALGKLLRTGPHRYVIGLLIALQPLFLLNCIRVANDALAVLLGTVTVVILLLLSDRRYWLGVTLGGLLLGLAILAKTINLALIPFVVFVFASLLWKRRITSRRAVLGLGLVFGLAVAVTFPYFHFNLTHFGMLTPLQESVTNRDAGKDIGDLVQAVLDTEWWDKFRPRYFRHSLWYGAWSALRLPGFLATCYEYNLYLAVLGFALVLKPHTRRERLLFEEPAALWRVVILCVGVAAALAFHAVQARMALGYFATNAWYAAVTFPWLLCLYYQGLALYPGKWIARLLATELLLLSLFAEIYGVLGVMVPAYAGVGWGALARAHLAAIHLPGCGPGLTIPAAIMTCLLTAFAVAVWIDRDQRAAGPMDQ